MYVCVYVCVTGEANHLCIILGVISVGSTSVRCHVLFHSWLRSNGSCCEMEVPGNCPHFLLTEREPRDVGQGDREPPCFHNYFTTSLFISDSQLKITVNVAHQFWCILTNFFNGLPQTFCLGDLLFQQKNWLWCIRPLIGMGRTHVRESPSGFQVQRL